MRHPLWLKRGLTIAPVAALTTALSIGAALAQLPNTGSQPCDPLIDGTYCATQGGRLSERSSSSSVNMAPIQSLSGDLALGQEQPATFAGVSFSSNNSICIGIFRRGACN
jgi:hypothetical protein